MRQRNGGNHHVVRTDLFPHRRERVADFAVQTRSGIVERQADELRGERIDFSVFLRRVGTGLRTVPQFGYDDGAQRNVGWRVLAKPLQQERVFPAHVGDADVRVEEVLQSRASRFSYSPCG